MKRRSFIEAFLLDFLKPSEIRVYKLSVLTVSREIKFARGGKHSYTFGTSRSPLLLRKNLVNVLDLLALLLVGRTFQ